MSEGGVGTCPQVFVVDSQASFLKVPGEKKPRWAREGQRFLLLLVGMSILGLIVEGCFIYSLYKKTEEFSSCKSRHLCHNLSNPATSVQQDGTVMGRVGSVESNEIPPLQSTTKYRPFAHLLGSDHPIDEDNVMQWMEDGEAVRQNMTYEKGRLIIQQEGYYYLYSKVQLNAAEECKLIQHKMMKETSAYGKPIELIKSKKSGNSLTHVFQISLLDPKTFKWKGFGKRGSVEQFPGWNFPPAERRQNFCHIK